ncbi:hypothetical protein C6988_06300 [Nitrosopumilus sp. b1]|uniref:hypothetical protein n=1 Tax=Nitrosopumilus sp. b1 TaxID=2109907 RepID=UPI0015F40D17|nr:hypothetical protein [Nitrosopumilus sp. b1]KAF6242788.1 hypothetical protein C6988_06300 [Nitrosopumilus sp. b1]
MVRVFYTQKTENLLQKMELSEWRIRIQKQLEQTHQEMSDDWKMCAIGERIKLEGKELESIKDLSPEAIKLGYDFSVALQERDNQKALEIIEKIELLDTIWRVN